MLTKLITCVVALLFCFSCSRNNQVNNYTRDSNGFYFKLLAIGDGNESPVTGNVLVFEAVMKTLADSVFWDTKHDATNGLFVDLNSELIPGSCNAYFLRMVDGSGKGVVRKLVRN